MSVFTFQYPRVYGVFNDVGFEAWKACHSKSGHHAIAMKKSHLDKYFISYIEFVKIFNHLQSQNIRFVIIRTVSKDNLQPGQEVTSTYCTENDVIRYYERNIS